MHNAKLGTIIDRSEKATADLSEISRKLCFSAIAVTWILREAGKGVLSERLRLVVVLVTLSLAVDFVQYLYKGVVWFILSKTKGKVDNESMIHYPEWVEALSYLIWAAKIILCLVGYVYLLRELYDVVGLGS